jgi:ribosomal protein S18 acetylase RimI-like enzyme
MSASDRNPMYYCPLSDRFIHLGEADFLVVGREAKQDLPKPGEAVAQANIVLRRAYEEEAGEVEDICRYFWDETKFDCFDQTFEIGDCVNILALAEGEIAGMLSWKKVGKILIIVLLNVYPEYQGQGIGRLLMKDAIEQARKQDCASVRVATTNDDLPALAYYQKLGFRIVEIALGLVAKHHKAELPGMCSIPIRDEIRLERLIRS